MYQTILKPLFFLFDPEKVHHFTFKMIKILSLIPGVSSIIKKKYCIEDKRLERNLFGITFKNPVGLAAGLDKDAKIYNELNHFGFGFIEIGTITPKPQDGNPKKRLFRLIEDGGIINRMGFNNGGIETAVKNLKKNKGVLIGGNIGKNKLTPNENAVSDYIYCFENLYPYVDYFVVNVSSPNTPNLRELQEKDPLKKLLFALQTVNARQVKTKPILLKIAPDLSESQLLDIIEIVKDTKIAGVIATNTTIERKNLKSKYRDEVGGLSGKPLHDKSTQVIKFLAQESNKAFPIIGVGGIFSAQDALDKLEAGADLIQLYTGFIYQGPGLIKEINKALLNKK